MNQKSHITSAANIMADLVGVIERLADESAQAGYYGLQDANLVLAESVRELQADNELSILVAAWFDLVEKFKDEPKQTATEIMDYLRNPWLNIPMSDDEFTLLAEQLANDANVIAEANGCVDGTVSDIVPNRLEQHS